MNFVPKYFAQSVSQTTKNETTFSPLKHHLQRQQRSISLVHSGCEIHIPKKLVHAQLNSFARWENVPLPGRLSHEGSWGLSRESQEVVIIVIVAIVGMTVVIRWSGN